VDFEYCNFPMETDDDVKNSIEVEKDDGNRISIHVYGIRKDIKNHCEDSLVGEYVDNIDDRLRITEDDYDNFIFPMCITKILNQMQFRLIYCILLMKIVMNILYT